MESSPIKQEDDNLSARSYSPGERCQIIMDEDEEESDESEYKEDMSLREDVAGPSSPSRHETPPNED
jgi:hypothetical protein